VRVSTSSIPVSDAIVVASIVAIVAVVAVTDAPSDARAVESSVCENIEETARAASSSAALMSVEVVGAAMDAEISGCSSAVVCSSSTVMTDAIVVALVPASIALFLHLSHW
jgi:hypothetical protein